MFLLTHCNCTKRKFRFPFNKRDNSDDVGKNNAGFETKVIECNKYVGTKESNVK